MLHLDFNTGKRVASDDCTNGMVVPQRFSKSMKLTGNYGLADAASMEFSRLVLNPEPQSGKPDFRKEEIIPSTKAENVEPPLIKKPAPVSVGSFWLWNNFEEVEQYIKGRKRGSELQSFKDDDDCLSTGATKSDYSALVSSLQKINVSGRKGEETDGAEGVLCDDDDSGLSSSVGNENWMEEDMAVDFNLVDGKELCDDLHVCKEEAGQFSPPYVDNIFVGREAATEVQNEEM